MAAQSTRFWPLHSASAVAILAVDWFLYFLERVEELDVLGVGVVILSVSCGLLVALVENEYARASRSLSAARAAAAALAVAVPLAVVGTALAGCTILWRWRAGRSSVPH